MVYVDDIITGNDITRIDQLKEHLFSHFHTKDLGYLKYFLGIEVTQSKEGVIIHKENMLLIVWRRLVWKITSPVIILWTQIRS